MRNWYKELKKEAPKAYWTKVKAILENDFKVFSQKSPQIEEDTFLESATGEFEIDCKDPELRKKFEKIKTKLQANAKERRAQAEDNKSEVVVMGELGIFED